MFLYKRRPAKVRIGIYVSYLDCSAIGNFGDLHLLWRFYLEQTKSFFETVCGCVVEGQTTVRSDFHLGYVYVHSIC